MIEDRKKVEALQARLSIQTEECLTYRKNNNVKLENLFTQLSRISNQLEEVREWQGLHDEVRTETKKSFFELFKL